MKKLKELRPSLKKNFFSKQANQALPANLTNAQIVKKLLRVAASLLLLALFSSCSDQGCIEAEDFGEYESQVVEVPANFGSNNCEFDVSQPLTKAPPSLITCFTTGTVTVTDESGNTQTSRAGEGCGGFSDETFKGLCIAQCTQRCLTSSFSGTTGLDPAWSSTTKKSNNINAGVTIWPGSEIEIRAIGNVSLGKTSSTRGFFVQADNPYPHSKSISWGDFVNDVKSGQTLLISTGGRWSRNNSGSALATMGVGGAGLPASPTASAADLTSDQQMQQLNGSSRLVAYVIAQPNGYAFDYTQSNNEKAGAKIIPLLPDVNAWQCTYPNDSNPLSFNCQNNISYYNSNGYTANAIDGSVVNSQFPLSSTRPTATLGSYGGMIRWDGDGLVGESFDPFTAAGISCNSAGACNNIASVSGLMGTLHGAQDGDLEITNNYGFAVKIHFRSLISTATSCNTNFSFNLVVKDTDNNTIETLSTTNSNPVVIGPSPAWSFQYIALEAGHKMVISRINDRLGATGLSCSDFIGYRALRYLDIPINQSGFVSFRNLTTTTGANQDCSIAARIINPKGSKIDNPVTGLSSDFSEYASGTSSDPFFNLIVGNSWGKNIFVRKGQSIRFGPPSWSGNWMPNASGTPKKCGIGMAMRIQPRPALLCRGNAPDLIQNSACEEIDRDSNGNIIGCKAVARVCSVSGSGSYCPLVNCQKQIINCVSGTDVNNYTKTLCDLNSVINGGSTASSLVQCRDSTGGTCDPGEQNCTDSSGNSCAGNYYANATSQCSSGNSSAKCMPCTYSSDISATSCQQCSEAMRAKALLPVYIPMNNIDQCYDLENYTGKVDNIPASTGFSQDQLSNPQIAKGAVKLESFNGVYGNFKTVVDTKSSTGSLAPTSAKNRIFSLPIPLTFANAGRLKFFVLDGNDFKASTPPNDSTNATEYTDNTASGASFGGQNGVEIITTNTLDFSNGQWLRARICRENDNTYACSNRNPTSLPNNAPALIDYQFNGNIAQKNDTVSLYNFDDTGYLIRTSPTIIPNADCTLNNSGVVTSPDQRFYCHLYNYASDIDRKNTTKTAEVTAKDNEVKQVRLTFQIFDPEAPNCHVPSASDTSTTNNGIQAENPAYDRSSANTGLQCGLNEANCKKQFLCINRWANNSGYYYVNVKVKKHSSDNASSFINSIIKPMIQILDGIPEGAPGGPVVGQAEKTYKMIISNPRFKALVTMSLVIMFTFYGLGYLMGVSELNQSEIIGRVIKIGLIGLFTGEHGWDYFNSIVVSFFKRGTDWISFMMASSFDNSPAITQALSSGDFYDKSVLFGSVDNVFTLIFSSAVQKKVSALLFASIFGWAYLLIIYYGFLAYIFSVANAVLLYITAQFFTSLLFTLGPIFFIFTLFSQTKEMFDSWLKVLIGFSLQQIFLLVTLAFFNMLMYEIIKMSLGYKICWDAVWTIHIISNVTLLEFWTIASLPPRTNAHSQVGNIGSPEGIPSLFTILYIWVVASLMQTFIGFMTDVANSLAGGISATALSKGVADMASKAKGVASKAIDKGWEMTGGQVTDRIDDVLFDSGKTADKRRADQEKQDALDSGNKKAMVKAGDEAVNKFKRENASELVGMSKEQQREKIKGIREKAMNSKGEELGLSKDKVAALKSDSGLKYSGNNVFGAALQAGKQAVSDGGSLRKSLKDKNDKIDSHFTEDEAKEAMRNMKTSEERDAFIKAAAKGNIRVGKTEETSHERIFRGKNALEGKAIKALEDSGQITKQSFNFLRNDDEKKKIRQEMRRMEDDFFEKTLEEKDGNASMLVYYDQVSVAAVATLLREKENIERDETYQEELKANPNRGTLKRIGDSIGQNATEAGKYLGGLGDRKKEARRLIKERTSKDEDEDDYLDDYNDKSDYDEADLLEQDQNFSADSATTEQRSNPTASVDPKKSKARASASAAASATPAARRNVKSFTAPSVISSSENKADNQTAEAAEDEPSEPVKTEINRTDSAPTGSSNNDK